MMNFVPQNDGFDIENGGFSQTLEATEKAFAAVAAK